MLYFQFNYFHTELRKPAIFPYFVGHLGFWRLFQIFQISYQNDHTYSNIKENFLWTRFQGHFASLPDYIFFLYILTVQFSQ